VLLLGKKPSVTLLPITLHPASDRSLSCSAAYTDAGLEKIVRLENLRVETAAVALERLFIVLNRLPADNSVRVL